MSDEPKANGTPKEPKVLGKEPFRPPLPKRFYKQASVETRDGAHCIVLDGRNVRTPGKRLLAVPAPNLAAAIADEWNAQGERIDPATMPLTRLANSALDGVADNLAEVAGDLAAFAASDLLCYRAEAPAELARRQAEAWDPVLEWAKQDLGAHFVCRTGVMPIEQPAAALAAVRSAVKDWDALRLAAVHVMTTLSGSALLAIAHARGQLSLDDAWAAAIVDETWQTELWGVDDEAEARKALRRAEFTAASAFYRHLGPLRR